MKTYFNANGVSAATALSFEKIPGIYSAKKKMNKKISVAKNTAYRIEILITLLTRSMFLAP